MLRNILYILQEKETEVINKLLAEQKAEIY